MARATAKIVNMMDAREAGRLGQVPRSLQTSVLSTHPCSACAGTCCQHLRAGLTTVEALRVAFAWTVALEDVVQRVAWEPGADAGMTGLPIPLADGGVTLRLRQAPGGGCTFLHAAGAQARCAIHAVRPGACRLFPFELQVGAQRLAVGDARWCPWKWLKDGDREREVSRDHAQWRADLRLERTLLVAWAARPGPLGTWAQYVAHASQVVQEARSWRAPTWIHPQGRPLGRRLW